MDAEELQRSLTQRSRPLRLLRVQGAAGAYLIARQLERAPGPALWIAPDRERAERALQDLRTFEAPDPWLFPAYDTPPFDRFSPHPEIEAQRMSALYRLLGAQPGARWIAVTTWASLMRRVLARDELRARVTHLERGLRVDRDALLRSLVAAGYHRASLVEERGEVALRGAILDLFPPQLERPVRLEIDYDEIVAIREFDPATQRSDKELRSMVAIPPRAVRAPADPEILLARVRQLGREFSLPESSIYQVAEALAHRRLPPAPESLEALFQGPLESAFDYLPADALVVVDDPEAAASARDRFASEVSAGFERAAQQDRLVSTPAELYLDESDAWSRVLERRPVLLDGLGGAAAGEDALAVDARDHVELRREISERVGSGHALEPLMRRLDAWKAQGRAVRLLCPSLSAAERLGDILKEYGHALPSASRPQQAIAPGVVRLEIASASAGFELAHEGLVVVTEQDLFGARLRRRPVRATRAGQAIDRLAQVQEGELLVHAEHGIGRYGGLVQLPVGGARQEFLLILFEGADKLYVPVSRLDRVQRYSGADDSTPRLDKLGGNVWQRTKGRVKKAVIDMARELIAVVAAREVLEGTAYPAPDADYEEFEARFPYEDTPDQRKATEDVLADLARKRPCVGEVFSQYFIMAHKCICITVVTNYSIHNCAYLFVWYVV